MPEFKRENISLYYEEHGEGFPVLLFAPGGMRSCIEFWEKSPWNPIKELAPHFRVIAMDQRNAGKSKAPVSAGDGWHSYAQDHVALMDHLGLKKLHVLGGCIGGAYCLGAIQAAPARIASAVLQQPIGAENNREAFYAMYDMWKGGVKAGHPNVSDADWDKFRGNMYDREWAFTVDRDFVKNCATPMLVLMGADLYHPTSTSREIADLAPNGRLMESWKDPEKDGTVQAVIDFLKANTP